MIGSIGPAGVILHGEAWRPTPVVELPESLSRPEDPSGRLRVGFWAPDLNLGGAEDWQRTLMRSVDRAKISWQGMAVVRGPHAADPRVVAEYVDTMPVTYGPDAAVELAGRCDVIVQWGVGGCREMLESIPNRPKVVAVLHWPEESTWVKPFYDQPGGIDEFVAVSELSFPTLPDFYRETPATIWNAIDPVRLIPKRSRAEMRAAWGVPDGVNVLGYIGRLEPGQKDPGAIVRALPHLPRDWHCVIVGEGSAMPMLCAEADRDARLHLPGGDRDAGSVLGAFDVLCVPSIYESFGLSLCEGLWAGVPVLSTRTGICKLVDGLTRVFHPGAPGEAIALTLYQDLNDPEATRSRVERARTWARRELTAERFGKEWTYYLLGLGKVRA